ncbi:MAG: glycosyltransferase [Flavobacteriaceae bacterium]
MRVLQLIDSLDAGGAERVAVTYANALVSQVELSSLCTTRKEGLLKKDLGKEVSYLFLRKKHALDIFAIVRLVRFIQKKKIQILHAHATSYFTATIIKILLPRMILIWHDHYGNSEMLSERKFTILKWCATTFNGVLCVNKDLENWALKNLKAKNVLFLKNPVTITNTTDKVFKLKGIEGKRIICLANIRPQKDHENLLKAFEWVIKKHPDYSLHLFGKNWGDRYYQNFEAFINRKELQGKVYYYGSQSNTHTLLTQASVGVLASYSEGLPLALLEYGLAGLGVVCTQVGQCEEVVNGFGQCVPPNNPEAFANAILYYIENDTKLKRDASLFQDHVQKNYSVSTIIPKLITYYEQRSS